MKHSIFIPYIAICLTLFSFSCKQQTGKHDISEYLDSHSLPLIDTFFLSVKSGTYKSGLISLLKDNQNIDLHDSSTILLVNKFNFINESSGKFFSNRLLRQNRIGDDLIVYSYLVKYEKTCYRYLFTFYNNGSKVKLFKFSFDDNLSSELEEGIKFYIKY
jgi:hypothetical protein